MSPTLAAGPADYPWLSGSGPLKLVDSAVAPLVALARGYLTLEQGAVKGLLAMYQIAPNSKRASQIRDAVGDTDALLMPWYTADQVVEMSRTGIEQRSPGPQLRPAPENARVVGDKVIKYENLAGSQSVIGPHPAVPASWLTAGGLPIVFTEGMLKADSALSAMLLAAGVTPAELAVAPGENDAMAARGKLASLMERIPQAKRFVIYGFLSVTTWKNHGEWNAINPKNLDVYVAFDGDVATNPHVHAPARELFALVTRKKGTAHLIDFSAVPTADGSKVGMDDYLSHHGDWTSMLALATTTLPEAPKREYTDGWRMNEADLRCEKWQPPAVEGASGAWLPTRYDFIARVSVIEDRRSLTEAELRAGKLGRTSDARAEDARVEIEVKWRDLNGKECTGTIYGPHTLLMTSPTEWHKVRGGVAIPSAVAALETWPPKELEFVTAMKRHRVEERVVRPLWEHMGWVPTADNTGTMVFVVGEQVIGPDGDTPSAAASGVIDSEVRRASQYGVIIPESTEQARQALREMLALYAPTNPADRVWQNPRHAAVVLAVALRPCVPIRPKTLLVLSGDSGAGKTWTSAAIMGFWQAEPGTWDPQSLPGSASDTAASSMVSISKTPLWVIDDLAPSAEDPHRSKSNAAAIYELLRATFNGSFRARRNADMTAQKTHTPRAVLVLSAEQAPSGQSIVNRVINVHVSRGRFLGSQAATNAVIDAAADHSPASVVTGYILRMLARRIEADGMDDLLARLAKSTEAHLLSAKAAVGDHAGDTTRQASIIADASLSYTMLEWMAAELNMSTEVGERLFALSQDLYDVAHDGYQSTKEVDLGTVVLRGIADLLSSHKAHIAPLGQAGVPVLAGSGDEIIEAGVANDQLGWTLGDEPRPNGPRIGTIIYDGDTPVVLFTPQAAMTELARADSRLSTHTAVAAFSAIIQSGLHHPKWSMQAGRTHLQKVKRAGVVHSGTAVPLATLLEIHTSRHDPLGEDDTEGTDET